MYYIANFKQINLIPPGVVPVSIATYPPKWYRGLQYNKLAPRKSIVIDYQNGLLNDFNFKQRYENYIFSNFDIYNIVGEILKLTKNKPFCFIVDERKNVFSCRRSIEKWFKYNDFEIISIC